MEDDLKAIIKPQYVDNIPRAVKGKVGDLIKAKANNGNLEYLLDALELNDLLDREISQLSGGELQRFAIALTACQKADM